MRYIAPLRVPGVEGARRMRIAALKIENFRAFKSETISFGHYTSLVGPNGAGKSTVLTALRVFFRDTADTVTDLQTLSEEDFNNKDTSQEIVISVTFEDLSEEAKQDLQHYYRHGKLVVSAVAHWDPTTKRAEVIQYGERMGLPDFVQFFDAEKAGKTVADLRAIYESIRLNYSGLPPAKTKPLMIDALRDYEGGHPDALRPIRSSDQFYGFTRGESLLKKYIQWVFVPAVKDASTENMEGKKNALRALLERTVRSRVNFEAELNEIREEAEGKYKTVLAKKQDALQALSDSLTNRVSSLAHAEASVRIQWDEDASRYVRVDEPLARVFGKEGDFEGDLSRFGHGFQRSYLLALLQELSGCLDTGDPKLILACEEPELHQHPPQARHLAAILELISQKNSQVIVCSHSPYFIRGVSFEDVRFVRYDRLSGTAVVRAVLLDEVAKVIADSLGEDPIPATALGMKIEQTLQERLKEMFFSPALVLVEGPEDVGYVESYFALMDIREPLRAHGCHVVPTTGKDCMIRPLAIAKLLEIPTFVVFDADGDDDENVEQNRKYNTAIMRLCGVRAPDPFPKQTFRSPNLCVWPTKVRDVVRTEIGEQDWDKTASELAKRKGVNLNYLAKNHVFIGQLLCRVWESGKQSRTLHDLCRSIMSFAIRERAAAEAAPPAKA